MSFDIDDPKLTAYALGELDDEAERERVEARLRQDPAARDAVTEIKRIGDALRTELAKEQLPSLERHTPVTIRTSGRRIFWRIAAGAIAACLIVGIGWSLFAPSLNRAREVATVKRERPVPASSGTVHESKMPGLVPSSPAPPARAQAERLETRFARTNAPMFAERLMKQPPASGHPLDASDSILMPVESEPGGYFNTESYDRIVDNPFLDAVQNPLSTFSIDVDTASYSNVRRFIAQGQLPPKDAVRIEEMLNYFTYDYPAPEKGGDAPFSSNVEVASCPWNEDHRLVRIGLRGKEIAQDERPATNLVFLIDVSGSMQPANKLPLLKSAMKLLVDQLGENDRVAIVVYAGSSGLVLPSTTCDEKRSILNALDQLQAGGSTNGAQGIELAYQTAVQHFIEGGANRVILCTDGDFNVGVTDQGALTRLIEDKAATGVFLSVLGFGMGNVKDSTMEKLADKGNGNYAYIDTLKEAKKVLVEQMSGTLVTIAKDVKIQVEFNPGMVKSYRLIGYENRMLAKEDFNDDTKDAGEIGAGHTVTALYEVVPAGSDLPNPAAVAPVDDLKYQTKTNLSEAARKGEMLTLKLRYKEPDGDTSKLLQFAVTDAGAAYAQASADFKFAAAVAGFGMILRDSPHKGQITLDGVLELALEGKGHDGSGYRAELIELIRKATALGRRS